MTETTEYRRGRHVVSALHTHLVFSTKHRRGVFDDETLAFCETTMRKVCADFGADLAEFNGETDHVHLLVHYPPKVSVSKLVNSLKGSSAYRLRREFTGQINQARMNGHLWSPSYLAASCAGAPLSILRQYIQQQHRPEYARFAARNEGWANPALKDGSCAQELGHAATSRRSEVLAHGPVTGDLSPHARRGSSEGQLRRDEGARQVSGARSAGPASAEKEGAPATDAVGERK